MESVGSSIVSNEPVRNEKIPRAQQRALAADGVAQQLRDAAERGASASIASISNFLTNLSDSAKNPKTNMNAMLTLIQTRQTRAQTTPSDENAVLLRSSNVWSISYRQKIKSVDAL
jgi:hypothetical protein